MNAWAGSARSRSALLPLLVVLTFIGCTARPTQPPQPTEPPIVGDPLPGSFYMTSDPPLAPHPLSIRIDDIGGPSGRSQQFEEGDVVVVNWSTLPLPGVKWIQINGKDCDGTFGIQARFETDLLLILTEDVCHVEVLGSHPEGGPHTVLKTPT